MDSQISTGSSESDCTTVPALSGGASVAEQEAAEWFENDARYLRKCEAEYRTKGDTFMVEKVVAAALHSENKAREFRGVQS